MKIRKLLFILLMMLSFALLVACTDDKKDKSKETDKKVTQEDNSEKEKKLEEEKKKLEEEKQKLEEERKALEEQKKSDEDNAKVKPEENEVRDEEKPEEKVLATGDTQLKLDGSFQLNGKEYKLPMKLKDFAAIEGLSWDKKEVTDIAGRSGNTESFFMNDDKPSNVHLVAEVYNFSNETIKKEEGVITALTFNADQGKLSEVSVDDWKKIITVDDGVTFAMDQKDFAKTYPEPKKEDEGRMSGKDGFYSYDYAKADDNTVSKLLSLQFTSFASKDKKSSLLKNIGIKIDDSKLKQNADNKI